jgi:C-terminal peptidase prc
LFIFAPLLSAQNLNFEKARMKDILDTVSGDVSKYYFDPTLNGLDWKAKVAEARAKIDKAQTNSQMITAIFALVDSLHDSHTVFLPPQRAVHTTFEFEALPIGDHILVKKVEKKGAAEKSGLKTGDEIVMLNGYRPTRENFSLMMLYFRALLPVSSMQLVVNRPGEGQKEIQLVGTQHMGSIITDLTKLDTIWQLIREEEMEEKSNEYIKPRDGIGYVHLIEFSHDPDEVDSLLGKTKDSQALIIDLRSNPGGSVKTLERMIGHFVTEPTIVADIRGRKPGEKIQAKPAKPNSQAPLFILVDSQSSSAAEIFARHFQRTKRAVIVGDHTSGRVQAANIYAHHLGVDTIVPYAIEISIGQVIFPDGESLEKKGVTPDVLCLPTQEDFAAGRDVCLAKARQLAAERLSAAAPKPGN